MARQRRHRWVQVLTLITGSALAWVTIGLLAGASLMALWYLVPGLREATMGLFGNGGAAVATFCRGLTMPVRMLGRETSVLLIAGFTLFAVTSMAAWTWLVLHANSRTRVPATRRSR